MFICLQVEWEESNIVLTSQREERDGETVKTVKTVQTVSTINKATKPLQTKVCPTAESFIPADYNISISSTGNFVFVWNKLNSL